MDHPGPVICKRCGNCCVTNLAAYITREDLERWERENRSDILGVLESESAIWAGDHLVSTKNGTYVQGCPFLSWNGRIFSCDIYETRPGICREYKPGSSELCSQFKTR